MPDVITSASRDTTKAQKRAILINLAAMGMAMVALLGMVVVVAGHLHFVRVLSGSMEPTYHVGDMAIVQDRPVLSLRVGDVPILPIPDEGGAFYSHRIIEVQRVNGETQLRTRGDANPAPDAWHLRVTSSKVPVVIGVLRVSMMPIVNGNRVLVVALWGFMLLLIVSLLPWRRKRATGDAPADAPADVIATS